MSLATQCCSYCVVTLHGVYSAICNVKSIALLHQHFPQYVCSAQYGCFLYYYYYYYYYTHRHSILFTYSTLLTFLSLIPHSTITITRIFLSLCYSFLLLAGWWLSCSNRCFPPTVGKSKCSHALPEISYFYDSDKPGTFVVANRNLRYTGTDVLKP